MPTQPDRSRRLSEVTDSMALAIEVLVSGGVQVDAAQASGVTRQTVSAWFNHHPGFQAALNLRRSELLAERTDRVRDLDSQALSVIAEAIERWGVVVS